MHQSVILPVLSLHFFSFGFVLFAAWQFTLLELLLLLLLLLYSDLPVSAETPFFKLGDFQT